MRLAATALCLLAAASARARPPSILVHSGRALGPGDVPIEGEISVEVCLYPERLGELPSLFCETYETQAFKGVYTVNIGEVPVGSGKDPLPESALRDQDKLYMTVNINGDGESSPRLPLGSVLFALKAADADTLAGKALAQHSIAWTQLTGVPADLADGQVAWGEVTGKPADFADGEIDWSELNNVPATATRTDAQVVSAVEAGAVDLAAGSTMAGAAISTGPHTASLPASAITYQQTDVAAKLADMEGRVASAEGRLTTAEGQTVPAGTVAAFALSACPAGWTEYTAGRGRYLVGRPASGTLAGTQGTALTDLEDRAVGQHSHGVTDPGHAHSVPAEATTGNNNYVTRQSVGQTFPISTASATTGVTIQNAGSVAGTNAPYVQLLLCKKS